MHTTFLKKDIESYIQYICIKLYKVYINKLNRNYCCYILNETNIVQIIALYDYGILGFLYLVSFKQVVVVFLIVAAHTSLHGQLFAILLVKIKAVAVEVLCEVMIILILATYMTSAISLLRDRSGVAALNCIVCFRFPVNTPHSTSLKLPLCLYCWHQAYFASCFGGLVVDFT